MQSLQHKISTRLISKHNLLSQTADQLALHWVKTLEPPQLTKMATVVFENLPATAPASMHPTESERAMAKEGRELILIHLDAWREEQRKKELEKKHEDSECAKSTTDRHSITGDDKGKQSTARGKGKSKGSRKNSLQPIPSHLYTTVDVNHIEEDYENRQENGKFDAHFGRMDLSANPSRALENRRPTTKQPPKTRAKPHHTPTTTASSATSTQPRSRHHFSPSRQAYENGDARCLDYFSTSDTELNALDHRRLVSYADRGRGGLRQHPSRTHQTHDPNLFHSSSGYPQQFYDEFVPTSSLHHASPNRQHFPVSTRQFNRQPLTPPPYLHENDSGGEVWYSSTPPPPSRAHRLNENSQNRHHHSNKKNEDLYIDRPRQQLRPLPPQNKNFIDSSVELESYVHHPSLVHSELSHRNHSMEFLSNNHPRSTDFHSNINTRSIHQERRSHNGRLNHDSRLADNHFRHLSNEEKFTSERADDTFPPSKARSKQNRTIKDQRSTHDMVCKENLAANCNDERFINEEFFCNSTTSASSSASISSSSSLLNGHPLSTVSSLEKLDLAQLSPATLTSSLKQRTTENSRVRQQHIKHKKRSRVLTPSDDRSGNLVMNGAGVEIANVENSSHDHLVDDHWNARPVWERPERHEPTWSEILEAQQRASSALTGDSPSPTLGGRNDGV